MIEAGQILQNRYRIEKQIGEGGMGAVYLAVDERFGTRVAIKRTFFNDAEASRAFEREAQLLNGLRHTVLPRVSDYFAENDNQFLVMEYIAGEDLFDLVKRDGAFPLADVLRWADNLLDALDYLHNQKTPVIHRDIKPQNLKLTPRGEIILLDFGLAKGSASEVTLNESAAQSVYGFSRLYAPLEQIQGTGTDPRSDLYSLAATVYHLATGEPPVESLTRATAVLSGGSDPHRPANAVNKAIPVAVSLVLHEAMAMNPDSRPASAAAMRRSLARAAARHSIAAAPENFDDAKTVTDNHFQMPTAGVKKPHLSRAAADSEVTKTRFGKTAVAARNDKFVIPPPAESFSPTAKIAAAALVLVLCAAGFAAWSWSGASSAPSIPAAQKSSAAANPALPIDAEQSMTNANPNANPVAANPENPGATTAPGTTAPKQTEQVNNDAAPQTAQPTTNAPATVNQLASVGQPNQTAQTAQPNQPQPVAAQPEQVDSRSAHAAELAEQARRREEQRQKDIADEQRRQTELQEQARRVEEMNRRAAEQQQQQPPQGGGFPPPGRRPPPPPPGRRPPQ